MKPCGDSCGKIQAKKSMGQQGKEINNKSLKNK